MRSFLGSSWMLSVLALVCVWMCVPVPVPAEQVFFAGYNGGFYIKTTEEGGMELRLGGSFDADYHFYAEEERADNRFDIRKARILFNLSSRKIVTMKRR